MVCLWETRVPMNVISIVSGYDRVSSGRSWKQKLIKDLRQSTLNVIYSPTPHSPSRAFQFKVFFEQTPIQDLAHVS